MKSTDFTLLPGAAQRFQDPTRPRLDEMFDLISSGKASVCLDCGHPFWTDEDRSIGQLEGCPECDAAWEQIKQKEKKDDK